MTDPDYDDLLWDLADRLYSEMTPGEIRKWLIDNGRYDRFATMSGDDLAAEIESCYIDLARICGVKAV